MAQTYDDVQHLFLICQEYLPWKHDTRPSFCITQMLSLGFSVHNGQLSFWMHHVCPPSILSVKGKKKHNNSIVKMSQ